MHLMFDFKTVSTLVISAFIFSWILAITAIVLFRIVTRAARHWCRRVFFIFYRTQPKGL